MSSKLPDYLDHLSSDPATALALVKTIARVRKISVVHLYDKENPKGGLTIAYRKVSPYASGIMVEVAVATCSPKDTYNRKVGALMALLKFIDGETIQLPLNRPKSSDGLATQVKWAFMPMALM